jgi:ABC-type nitrate/sulfonate/bicarbonate transport system substrate-binding protein
VKRTIESGRFSPEEETVQAALEILAARDEAETSLARNEGRQIKDASMEALAEKFKQRGRLSLDVERKTIGNIKPVSR